jgi:hypothetical protein
MKEFPEDVSRRLVVVAVILSTAPQTALGYIDPGTGSMLLQGLIALAGGILATIGLYWRSIRRRVARLLGRDSGGKPEGPVDR